ncbi:hypothetical protein, partial [Flavonifractor plautii]|uniref:hypothetical protein n=1 Tax=Flavonifractor plautii TaxID=292800 RepID=UPI00195EA262
DNHHANQHDRRQSQAESPLEVSHLDFLLLNFEPEGRMTPLASVRMIKHLSQKVNTSGAFVTKL